jgi:hypothetical protein
VSSGKTGLSRNEPEETGRWKAINQGDNVFDPRGRARSEKQI